MATTKKPAVKATTKAVKETETAVKPAKATETAVVKEEAAPKKKAACKKTTAAPATKSTITIQYQGKDYTEAEIIEACKADYTANGFEDAIETLDIYVQPENGIAYYAVNGFGGDKKIDL